MTVFCTFKRFAVNLKGRTGLGQTALSRPVEVISTDRDAMEEIESWRQMVGLEELQVRWAAENMETIHVVWQPGISKESTIKVGSFVILKKYVTMMVKRDGFSEGM